MPISFPMTPAGTKRPTLLYDWNSQSMNQPTAPSLLNQQPVTQPAPAANYMDALERFKLPTKDVNAELNSMGILDRASADQQYAAGQTERDQRMKQFALGQMLGALGGTVAGRFLGDPAGTGNANGQQAVQNLLPGLAGTQAMMQHTGQEDHRATQDHATSLKNYYDAMFNVRKENQAVELHNQETGLGLYKADKQEESRKRETPTFAGYDDFTGGDGSIHKVAKFANAAGQIVHMQPIDAGGSTIRATGVMDHQVTQDLKDEADSVKRIRVNTDKIRVAKEIIGKAEQAKKSGNYAAIAEALNGTGETDIDKYIESLNGTLRDRKAENDQLIEGIPQDRRVKHGLGSSAKSFNIKGGSIGGQKKWFE